MTRPDPAITRLVDALPVFSEHEHHVEDVFFRAPYTVERALTHSSAIHTQVQALDGTTASRESYLEAVRQSSHFLWFERGLQTLHGLRAPLTATNWERNSTRLVKAYADPDFHWKSLQQAGYCRQIQDAYWNPGDDTGHPELFRASFRIDDFLMGFHPEAPSPQQHRCWAHFGFSGGRLADFVAFMRERVKREQAAGRTVCLKCAQAYDRPLGFAADDIATARRVFGRHPAQVTEAERWRFGDYMFNRVCELAAELDVPIQLHTGTARLSGSNPLRLEETIRRHPRTRFVLFHIGYPWVHEAAALAYAYRNVVPSLACAPTMATSVAVQALHEHLDVARNINAITWGSDCWLPEESVGALLAWRHVVSVVLTERVAAGLTRPRDVDALAERLMYRNGQTVYRC